MSRFEEAVHRAAGAAVDRPARPAEAVEQLLRPELHVAVGAPRAHLVQEAGEPADRRRVGAPVVVDDDDEPAVVVVADVVERLPRHPARERAVADDGHDVPVGLAGHLERPRDAVRPGQGGGRVRALDDVVGALGAAGIAGQAARLAQPGEVLPPGQQLVHVRLVAGVEDDGVPGRVEHPVDRDGQLDDAEVRAEVAAGLRHRGDEELPDLRREPGELLAAQPVEVPRSADRLQYAHEFCESRRAPGIGARSSPCS
jgi:hypothetical protein